MAKRKQELIELCGQLGVQLNPNVKYRNKDLVHLLGQKHIEKGARKLTWALNERVNLDSPMLCQWYKNLKDNQKKHIMEDSNEWVAERKWNGCFPWETPITLADGSTMPIGKIVDERLPVEVLSYDTDKKEFVTKKVVNWFNNGKKPKEDWCRLSYSLRKGSKLTLTKNHYVYTTNRGWVTSQELNADDTLIYSHNDYSPNQLQVIYGSLLGDGCLDLEKRSIRKIKPSRLKIMHSDKQKDYFMKKMTSLGGSEYKTSMSGFGSLCFHYNTLATPLLSELRHKYYRGSSKVLDKDLLNSLDLLGLAIWYMDDGTRALSKDDKATLTNKFSRAIFCVNGYTEAEVDLIIEFFLSLGWKSTKRLHGKKGFTVEICSLDSVDFYTKIAPYIPESMEYKIPKNLRGGEKIEWWNDNEPKKFLMSEATLKEPITTNYRKCHVAYDIEVEDTHCYFASNLLVHNCRMVCFYHPDFGFQFFSRHHSEIDFLPIEYDNLLINVGNDFLDGASYKDKYKFPFIIDTEVITSEKDLDLTILPKNMNKVSFGGLGSPKPSFMINSELNAACSIIQYNKDDSYLLQKSNPLIFQVFDVIMVNNIYLYNQPLKKRLEFLQELMKYLPPCFRPCELVNVSKMNYYEKLIENENAEGIVLKSLLSPYNNSGTRHADKWVKLKRSLAETVGDDLDVFVTGYNEGTGKNEGLVGSIEFSVYLRDKNGLLREHVIANIGGLSDNFRRFITDTSDGKPRLRKELYGKVFVINGHTVSARNLRFNHAVLVNEIPRLDKNASQCDLDEEVLRANIL